jgi:hypothetical protein
VTRSVFDAGATNIPRANPTRHTIRQKIAAGRQKPEQFSRLPVPG